MFRLNLTLSNYTIFTPLKQQSFVTIERIGRIKPAHPLELAAKRGDSRRTKFGLSPWRSSLDLPANLHLSPIQNGPYRIRDARRQEYQVGNDPLDQDFSF